MKSTSHNQSKLFVIDTARVLAWRTAFPNADHVCNGAGGTPWQVGVDDVVFAHTHETAVAHNSDLLLVEADLDPNLRDFCQVVRDAAVAGCSPRIILYSGGGLKGAPGRRWKSAATATTGPFYGVPPQRIDVLGDAISQRVPADRLKNVITAVLESPTSGSVASTGDRASISVAEQLDRNAEAVLAARLIVDAAKECGHHPSVEVQGIRIICPDSGLTSKAKLVIQANESGLSLESSVKELDAILGVINS